MSNSIQVEVPDIGDVSDVDVIEILVSEGDEVAPEDGLIVLETDKATMDVPSPAAGVVEKIELKVGDKVSKGSLILTLKAEEAEASEAAPAPEPETAVEPTTAPEPEVEEQEPEASEEGSRATETKVQEVKVPDIGEHSGVEVIEIIAHPGDSIEKEDTLIVLETEKATMDVPSPIAGKVVGINVVVGDKVSMGDVIGTLETLVSVESKPAEPAKVAESISAPKSESAPASSEPPVPSHPAMNQPTRKGLVHASPAVRRFARELGADLTQVSGSGNKGRILKSDVQSFVKYELSRPKATAANSGAMPTSQRETPDFSKFGEIESKPLSRIQKVSSVNLHQNWVSIPHVTQHDEADITELENFRKGMKAEAAAEDVKLTLLAFIMKAVVSSLKAFPTFNASLASDGENLILKKYYHIGVAVDTPDGLVVPVVRDCDKKSVYQIAQDLTELSAKAREKKLGIDAMQGSCFTISSLGGIGGTAFTPIVNWPDVAILGVSKGQMKPVWNGADFVPRLMLPLSLSYDHRVIDGAVAARFITHLNKTLSDIRRVIL